MIFKMPGPYPWEKDGSLAFHYDPGKIKYVLLFYSLE